jgi:hypothetical protein
MTKRPVKVARRMRASSLSVQGSTVNEPRHGLAHPEREARRARHLGCISLVPFARLARKGKYSLFVQAKKVTRSPEGRVEAFALKHQKIKSKVTG